MRSRRFIFLLFGLGFFSSLMNTGILLLINNAFKNWLQHKEMNISSGVLYLLLIVFSFLAASFFQRYMVQMSNDILYGMEMGVIEKIRNASFQHFERVGSERVYSAISDARVLSRIPGVFVNLVNSSITILCTLGYLLWTSFLSGAILLAIMAGLLWYYIYRDVTIAKELNVVRDLQDIYYDNLQELLTGFRQIRVSDKRNDTLFFRFINANRARSKLLNISASKKYAVNELSGVYSWYVILGLIIFVIPLFAHMEVASISAFVTAVLFMMSPLSQVIIFFPSYTNFKIAIERIEKLDRELGKEAVSSRIPFEPEEFSSLRLEDISYAYGREGEFSLNVPDLALKKAEIVFISGGNGSGKSTFIGLLTGLLKPDAGKVFINGRETEWEKFARFSNNMAVIFTNHHLFRENYDGHDLSVENKQFMEYVDLLNLKEVIRIDRDRNCINNNLSKGQQKRVALLFALLEDKPIIVLDEWAAEQDALNKRLFYTQWLGLMKNAGKTVVAVTHDDDYFQYADRVIRFASGEIVNEHKINVLLNIQSDYEAC